MSSFLKTDLQMLLLLDAAIANGSVDQPVTFELFARKLPGANTEVTNYLGGRPYGVVAGAGRFIDELADFYPQGPEDWNFIHKLVDAKVINNATLKWLHDFPGFRGDIIGYPDGELFFAGSPILTVRSTYGHALLVETLALSIYNFDCAVASAASRIRVAARDKRLVDMGSRRGHDEAAIDAARAAFIGGFSATSNMAASAIYGVPWAGTMAHNWVLHFGGPENELAAFESWFRNYGPDTVILVDTYDCVQGMKNAFIAFRNVFGPDEPYSFKIRIDSGDHIERINQYKKVRGEFCAKEDTVELLFSGDLSYEAIFSLETAPGFPHEVSRYSEWISGYGVGTDLITGGGSPTCGFVFKMVESNGQAVSKTDPKKGYVGGRKLAMRYSLAGLPVAERLYVIEDPAEAPINQTGFDREVLQVHMCHGTPNPESMPTLKDAVALHRERMEGIENVRYSKRPLLVSTTEETAFEIKGVI